VSNLDYISLILLSIGLSLDDFALAFALCLAISSKSTKERVTNSSKMTLAFSISTGFLPLLGWAIGLAIMDFFFAFSAWIILIVFGGVGIWILKEAFEDETSSTIQKWKEKNLTSFWVLLIIGTLGSMDEGAVGIGYPFLSLPIIWIIVGVIICNGLFVFLAMYISTLTTKINQKIPSILSGLILLSLGIINWVEILF